MSSQRQKRADHAEAGRMPSVSEIYELFRQLGDQTEATCVITLPRPRFTSGQVIQWAKELNASSGLGGVHFHILSYSTIVEDRHIDVYLRVRRLIKPQP